MTRRSPPLSDLSIPDEPVHVEVCSDPYDAALDSHAVVFLTEWDEFANLDFERIYKSMLKPAYLFDGRNILDLNALRSIGFRASGIGKG